MSGVPGRSDLDGDLALAIRAARSAGEAVLHATPAERAVRYKSDGQPVTGADLAADRILREILVGGRPGYGWLSEESPDSTARLEQGRIWVVDPIDGTSGYVAGRPEYAVCVGLAEAGEAVLGVVHNPATGELFHAVRGRGAFRDGVPVRVSRRRARPRMVASWSELERGELAAFAGWTIEPLGSTAYRMCRVAEGGAEGFVSRGPKAEWDVCAPLVVVREAGGRVTRLDGGALAFNRPDPAWTGLAVSNGLVHDALLRPGGGGPPATPASASG